jgi:outer membrane receptor protein involved in Fe transport
MNFTWLANEKHQVRVSASKTVSRPEFRELAPFSFYDFYFNGNVTGNPALKQGDIINLDLRYEWFPGKNQMFSTSVFYKHFVDPVEFTFNSAGAGTRTFNYQNLPGATLYGLEAEFRKNFEFIHPSLEDLVFFSNAAVIRSELNLENVSAYDTTRAMQGQSPYIVNAGLSFQLRNLGLSTTLVYNVIGDRVWQVGQRDLYGDVYERHRNLLDFQIGKKLGERGEIKLNISDILSQDIIYYQDINANHSFDDKTDNIMQKWNPGTTFSLSLGYKI